MNVDEEAVHDLEEYVTGGGENVPPCGQCGCKEEPDYCYDFAKAEWCISCLRCGRKAHGETWKIVMARWRGE